MKKYDKSIKLMIISLLILVNNYFIPVAFTTESNGFVREEMSFVWLKNIITIIGIGFFLTAIFLIIKELCKMVIQFFKS